MRRVVPLLLAAACSPSPEPTASWVEPLDGQTGWALDAPLVVVTPALDVPPDYEVRDRVRVVDLADGGFVKGTMSTDGDRVLFTPGTPWLAGRRYAWVLESPPAVPHGPEWSLPEGLAGTAVFDTDPAMEILAAGLDPDGRACFVLSARAKEPTLLVDLTIDDEPAGPTGEVELVVVPQDEWAADLIDAGLEPQVDVACLAPQIVVEVGARLRVWLDGDGPWLADLEDTLPVDLVAARHRFVPADGLPAEGDTAGEEP